MAPSPPPLALVQSVWFASSAKTRWCVAKQVLMSVHLPVAGSYIERWRPARLIGNALADGWLEPFLQKSGLFGWRTRAVNQTRPRSSIIGLWMLALLSQIG